MLITRPVLQGTEQENPRPDFLIPMREGVGGISDTLDAMVSFTKQFRQNLIIRRQAEAIIAGIPGKNYWAEAEAIHEWVKNTIRYTQDPFDVETLKTPVALLESRMGDCDDMATLAGTLLQTLGHPVRYVAVGQGEPGIFNHVFLETKIGMRWVAMECTEPVGLGWSPEVQYPRMVRNV